MTGKRLVDRLKKVRELLEKPERWCQKDSAVDADGNFVNARSRKAVAFCLMGAAIHVSESMHVTGALSDALPENVYGLTYYNDQPERTHADILRVVDQAIANAERHA